MRMYLSEQILRPLCRSEQVSYNGQNIGRNSNNMPSTGNKSKSFHLILPLRKCKDFVLCVINPVFLYENNQYYFYHNDHLGTPQKITDIDGNEVWSAEYTVFGEATVSGTITNNLRFPGQYYDAETGLHYNWQRYYNPLTGRYTQTDPIGFWGGDVNLYRYVVNSPVNWIDPYGLLKIPFTDIWIPAGEQYGHKAAMYWAERSIDPNNKWYQDAFYYIMGLAASLWTPCTSDATFSTLTAAYGAAKYFGRPFWQYYPVENPTYYSRWLTRGWGWKQPFKVGTEARSALNLPPWNPATAVRQIKPKWYEPVIGPGTPKPQPNWGWHSPGKKWSQYYRATWKEVFRNGWRLPD